MAGLVHLCLFKRIDTRIFEDDLRLKYVLVEHVVVITTVVQLAHRYVDIGVKVGVGAMQQLCI